MLLGDQCQSVRKPTLAAPPRLLKLFGSTGSRNRSLCLPEPAAKKPARPFPPPALAALSHASTLPPLSSQVPLSRVAIPERGCTVTTAPDLPPNSAGMFPVRTFIELIVSESRPLEKV